MIGKTDRKVERSHPHENDGKLYFRNDGRTDVLFFVEWYKLNDPKSMDWWENLHRACIFSQETLHELSGQQLGRNVLAGLCQNRSAAGIYDPN